jgi:hypothetical protein
MGYILNLDNKELAREAARKLYEKGLLASSIVRSLKKGGHRPEAVAAAVKFFPEMDAMLFGESWGGDVLEQHAARGAFLRAA